MTKTKRLPFSRLAALALALCLTVITSVIGTAAVSEPDSAASAPTLAAGSTWYTGTTDKSKITQINFVDDQADIKSRCSESWPAAVDADGDGALDGDIMCYVRGTELTIAGNGSGSIKANENASCMFEGFYYTKETKTGGLITTTDYKSRLTAINNLALLDTSDTKDMSFMFSLTGRASTGIWYTLDFSLKNLDLSNFNTRNVITMEGMFNAQTGLTNLDLSSFTTGPETNRKLMFSECSNLTEIIVSDGWTPDPVAASSNMFYGCSKLLRGATYHLSKPLADFSDVPADAPYAKALRNLRSAGIIGGCPDSTFRPDSAVTWGQFCQVVHNAFGKYVAEPALADEPVTYASALARLVATMGLTEENVFPAKAMPEIPGLSAESLSGYSSCGKPVSDGLLYAAYRVGIMDDVSIDLNAPMTRADMVMILDRALAIEDITAAYNAPTSMTIHGVKVRFVGNDVRSSYNDVAETLARFPGYVLEAYAKEGARITIATNVDAIATERIPNRMPPGALGFILHDGYDIYILRQNNHVFCWNLAHELSHFIHFELMSSKDKVAIRKLYNDGSEVAGLTEVANRYYCGTDGNEFFAELGASALFMPERLLDRIPASAEIVMRYLK